MANLSVRYIVNDVEAAIGFYRDQLGFELDLHPAPGFARLSKGGWRLLLNRPGAGGAGQSIGGEEPAPGGWNRFQLEVENLEAEVERQKGQGCRFCTRSSRGTEASRSWRRIRPATSSSSLNPTWSPRRANNRTEGLTCLV